MTSFSNKSPTFLQLAGIRYWTASLLPAIIGITLPFWSDPPGFRFRLFNAICFLFMTVICHGGFALLHNCFEENNNLPWTKKKLFTMGLLCIIGSLLIGLYLNSTLQLHTNVPEYIFILYGVSTLFVGILYVAPPFYFCRRLFGETIICAGLGLIPIIGAYLTQVGDITRTVYLAALPVVIATGLWVWVKELIHRRDDEKREFQTTVMYFPANFSNRIIPLLLNILIYAAIGLAVLGRSSISPISLFGFLSVIFSISMMKILWENNGDMEKLETTERYAFLIHLSVCSLIIAGSLFSMPS